VRQVLTNEKYIGNNVYNRTSFKLKKKHVRNAPDMWVRSDEAFDAIVPSEAFFIARGILQERCRRLSNDEMLAQVRDLANRDCLLHQAEGCGKKSMSPETAIKIAVSRLPWTTLASRDPAFLELVVNHPLRPDGTTG
jgi:hypothetical protein